MFILISKPARKPKKVNFNIIYFENASQSCMEMTDHVLINVHVYINVDLFLRSEIKLCLPGKLALQEWFI